MSLYSEQSWVANGQGTNDGLRFNFFNNKFQGGGGGTLNLNINSPYYPQAPYFSAQLPNGGVVTFYRWVATSRIPTPLQAESRINNPIPEPGKPSNIGMSSTKKLTPKDPIANGKVYHIYTEITISGGEYTIEFVPPY